MSDSNRDEGQSPPDESGDAWIESRVIEILAEESQTAAGQIDRDTRLFDLGDSLTRVEILMDLEDEFELSISDEEADRIKTVGELVDAVRRKVDERKHAASP